MTRRSQSRRTRQHRLRPPLSPSPGPDPPGRPGQPRKADLETLGRRLKRTGTDLERRAGQATKIAADHASTLRARTDSTGHGKGGHSDPAVTAALSATASSSWRWQERLATTTGTVLHALDELETLLGVLASIAPVETPGADTCEACKRPVPGTTIDRLKSGYCVACYASWYRKGRPDRHTFEQERRERARG